MTVAEGIVCITTFRGATGAKYRAANLNTHLDSDKSRTKEALLNPITWICSFFLLFYVGVEVALGGWLVTFMIRVRQ